VNSTQLRQYRVLTRLGIVGVLGDEARGALSDRLGTLPWPQQATALLNILEKSAGSIVQRAESVLNPMLAHGGKPDLEGQRSKGDELWSALSKVSPVQTIIAALDRLL
jgi:hypothetical protein